MTSIYSHSDIGKNIVWAFLLNKSFVLPLFGELFTRLRIINLHGKLSIQIYPARNIHYIRICIASKIYAEKNY